MTNDLDDFMNQHDAPAATSMEDESNDPQIKKRKHAQEPNVSNGIV